MDVSAHRAWALLKDLAFERVSGSEAEKAAADRLLKMVNERSYNDAALDEIAHLIKENAAKLVQE